MGSSFVPGFRSQEVSDDVILEMHLANNHYPSVHPSWVPVAKAAIKAARADDWARVIHPEKSVEDIMMGLHLYDFIEDEDISKGGM